MVPMNSMLRVRISVDFSLLTLRSNVVKSFKVMIFARSQEEDMGDSTELLLRRVSSQGKEVSRFSWYSMHCFHSNIEEAPEKSISCP